MGEDHWQFMQDNAGQPHDPVIVQEAVKQVEEFCKVLELEGVRVRRPEPMLWDKIGTMKTPYFETGGTAIVVFNSLLGRNFVVLIEKIVIGPSDVKPAYFVWPYDSRLVMLFNTYHSKHNTSNLCWSHVGPAS